MAYKVFTNGSVLNASEVNDNLMNQAVITFTNSTARASAITSPVEGMVTYLADTDTYQFWNGTAWTNLVSSSGSGNAVINGAFEINQRNFTSSTVAGYGFDRWGLNFSGATGTFSAQTFTLGTEPAPGFDGASFLRSAMTVGSDFAGPFTRLEDARSFAGQTVTISFYAKGTNPTTAGNLKLRIRRDYGSGGSTGELLQQSNFVLTANWTRYSFTIAVPSLSGKTLGQGSHVELLFGQGDNTSVEAWTLDLWGVQVEAGSTATPFRRNANSLQGELAACQRYYYRVNAVANGFAPIALGYAMSTTSLNIFVQPASQMRNTPTSVEFSTLRVSGPSNSQVVSAVAISSESNANVIKLDITSSGLTSSANYHLSANNSTAGFLGLSAEL